MSATGVTKPKDVSYEIIRDPNDASYGRNIVTGMSIRGRIRDTKNVSYAGRNLRDHRDIRKCRFQDPKNNSFS
jgi:hypothetical protein